MIRALVVDDEGPARARLRALLAAHEDVDVVGEAEDGAEALQVAPGMAPDVVFLDVAMPGATGLEVARSMPESARVVFCTAYERHAVDAFDLDAAGYLLKPVSSAALARTLDRIRKRTTAAELRAAVVAQRALLGKGERRLASLTVAAACRQARGVGGDWFDTVSLPGGAVALAVGDVSGKGLDAGIFMASVQAHLEHALRAHDPSLPAAMAALNAKALIAGGGAHYATVACVRFDPASGRLDAVSAGHPLPLLVRPGEWVRALASGGPPAGLLDRGAWRSEAHFLRPGDRIVLYTDGIAESVPDLVRLVEDASGLEPARMRDFLLEAAAASEDDRTVLVARVEAGGAA